MRASPRIPLYAGIVATLAVVAFATPAAAEGSMDSIVDLYKNSAASWGPTLRNYALGLFGILAAIEVGYTFIKMAIRGADMGEFLSELVTRVLFIGFFLWLLTNSGAFSAAIVDSFRQAGNAAAQAGGGSGGVRPSDIFEAGLDMAVRIMETDTGWGLEQMGEKIALMLAGIVLLICFALLTAFLILALVESYIVMSAGTLLMGFGGSRWTKDFAIKQMTYCVSVGAKLFVIQLLVGISEAMVKGWADTMGPAGTPNGMEDIFTMIGASLVMVALVKTIPDTVQGIINGVSPGGGGALPAAAAAMGGAMAGAAASALGGGAAVSGASKLASEQLKGAGGGAGGSGSMSGFGKAGAHLGQMAKNLGGAAKDDIGARLGGQNQKGTMGGRMGQAMSQEAKGLAADRAKPMAPMMPPSAQAAPMQPANDGGGSIKPGAAAAAPSGGSTGPGPADLGGDADDAAPTAVHDPIRSAGAANDEPAASATDDVIHAGAPMATAALMATGTDGAPLAAAAGPVASATGQAAGGQTPDSQAGTGRQVGAAGRGRGAASATPTNSAPMEGVLNDAAGMDDADDAAPAAGSTIATSASVAGDKVSPGPTTAAASAASPGTASAGAPVTPSPAGEAPLATSGTITTGGAGEAPAAVSGTIGQTMADDDAADAADAKATPPPALGGRLGGQTGRSGPLREIRGAPRKPKGPGGQ